MFQPLFRRELRMLRMAPVYRTWSLLWVISAVRYNYRKIFRISYWAQTTEEVIHLRALPDCIFRFPSLNTFYIGLIVTLRQSIVIKLLKEFTQKLLERDLEYDRGYALLKLQIVLEIISKRQIQAAFRGELKKYLYLLYSVESKNPAFVNLFMYTPWRNKTNKFLRHHFLKK